MKTLNMIKKSLPLVLAGLSANAAATDFTATLTFDTLAEITLTPIRALDFGPVLALTPAASCVMDPVGAGTETLSAGQLGVGTPTGYTASGDLGTGCGDPDANGQVGIIGISAYADAGITVEVIAGAANDIAFTPDAYVADFTASNTATFDQITEGLGNGQPVQASPDLTANLPAGQTRIIVGGTIVNQVALTADGSYTADYDVNVIYQ
ncbi:hypothetical protein RT723_08090 [Psychrosphaera aquimarina]|uniref:DUF4402 domain-containing protein n=1 Tax=Psychrosphaera aquimarina TaxID=2044854 RepID=A0ABU3R0K6_9GAMM|nr:hypothetical protein [Psychrosphaera aquimarina]MDU0112955.1 hypothetical protein [Psychrosphaera aquimarina]